ncbi:autotransporter outer membrane beta-barrel domain-containing protein [Salmonella enterica]
MKKLFVTLLLLSPITGMADSSFFDTNSVTFKGSGKQGAGQSSVKLIYIKNINSAEQLNNYISNHNISDYNFIFINAGYKYHHSPGNYNDYIVDSESTLGGINEPLVLNGNGYTEYNPDYNGFYNPQSSDGLYDITKHTFFKIGIGNYNNFIVNNAAVSTGNFFTTGNANISMPASISEVTLNNSFLYVNQLGDYNGFTANGHSTIAVVGTYLSHFYTSIPAYDFTQYIGTEYFVPYYNVQYGKNNIFSVKIKNASYSGSSKEILRGDKGRLTRVTVKNGMQYAPFVTTAESYNSAFRDSSSLRIMQLAIAHSPLFYDNSQLQVEDNGAVADAVLNQHSTAVINPGAKMSGVTQLNDYAKIMFGADVARPIQVDDLRMNTKNNLASVLEYTLDGGSVNINNLTMKDSRLIFQRTHDAGKYVTLNVAMLSGRGKFNMNTNLSEGKGDFLSIGHGTGNYQLVVADSGKEINKTTDNVNLVLNKQGDAVFRLSSTSGINVPGVDGGTYIYTLQNKKNKDGEYWYLNTKGEDKPSEPSKPVKVLSPSSMALLSLSAAHHLIFKSEIAGLTSPGTVPGNHVWGSYLNYFAHTGSPLGAKFDLKQNGFVFGTGNDFFMSRGSVKTGGIFSYSGNHLAQIKGGTSTVNSTGYGVYAQYLDLSGAYIAGVVKINQFSNRLSARMTGGGAVSAHYHQTGAGASVEVGYHHALNSDFTVRPYLKNTYFITQSKNIQLSNGMSASTGNEKSFRGGIGVMLSMREKSLFNGTMSMTPYMDVSLSHEFIRNNPVSINGNRFSNDFYGNAVQYAAGVKLRVTDRFSVHIGGRFEHESRVNSVRASMNMNYSF